MAMAVNMMESMLLYGFLMVISIGLLIISIFSYTKSHNKKLLFVTAVFFIFAVEGIIMSISLFVDLPSYLISIRSICFFNLIALVMLFMATLKK